MATPVLPRISRTSLVDEVIDAMRKMLAEETWPAGSKLPSEQELARQLGVGRSTIREALRVLGHLGMVEARSGLGTYVVQRGIPEGGIEVPLTSEGIRELYEFRHLIEIPAARLAAQRRSEAQLETIKSAWAACAPAIEAGDAREFARLDYIFHLSIVQASQNRFAIQAYRNIENAFYNYVDPVLAMGPLRSMLSFHDGVITGIERQDPEAAVKAVKENFVETDIRLRLLSERPTS